MKKITHTLLLFLLTSTLLYGQAFITTWKTDNPGTSGSTEITIPTTGAGYNYSVDWGDGNTDSSISGDITHTYASPGTYTVAINGDFPRIYFSFGGDKDKLMTIEQWGDIEWTSMERAFGGCTNLTSDAPDAPNLTAVTSLQRCFTNCSNFNGSIGNWNTATITDMTRTFHGTSSFNQNISGWNTAEVTIMQGMFQEATSFNQDITGWNTTKVIFLAEMFKGASAFDQNLGNWDIGLCTQMSSMFNSSGLSQINYDKTLQGWAAQTVQSNVTLGAVGIDYCTGAAARAVLIGTYNWTINDGNENCIVNIPDANFKAALLADAAINTIDDGEITVGEAEAYAGAINVSSSSIMDLTGIEYFSNITNLNALANDLGAVDLSNNTQLTEILIQFSDVTSLNVTGLDQLFRLNAWSNQLTTLDLSTNAALREMDIKDNSLSSIDVSNNTLLTRLVVNNNTSLGTLDLSTNPDIVHLQVANCGLSSGIDLSNQLDLVFLSIGSNNLNSLDLAPNTLLQDLRANPNNLTTLDISNNTAIKFLRVGNNNLTELDLTGLNDLIQLFAQNNMLTSIDMSGNPDINVIRIEDNSLTSLNLANGNNSNTSNFNIGNNPNLTCITVDDVAYSQANWTDIDAGANFSTDCDVIEFPDANFEAALLANALINTNSDAFIQVAEAEAFTGTMSANSASITNLTGIEYFTSMVGLYLNTNPSLTSIDLSNNTALEHLEFANCGITSLDLSNNSSLLIIRGRNNSISNIDLSNNSLLAEISLGQNSLTSIDVSANTVLQRLYINNNDISTIDLSNNTALIRFNGSVTLLTSLDLSNNTALKYLEVVADLTSIDLTNNTALETLSLGGNELTSLDVSNNLNLFLLWASSNQLTTLDLSGHSSINNLSLKDNQLTALNVANGNNSNFSRFELTGNANLTCITVDDVAYSQANWTDIDAEANFSTNCGNVETEITGFSLMEESSAAIIDAGSKTVNIEVAIGTDVTNLSPTISTSSGAIISPNTGVVQNFTSAVDYTVTAENPTVSQVWTVTVIEENVAPTDIALSNSSINENNAANETVGSLSSTDGNSTDSFSYSLVTGNGDTDNASFSIIGSELQAAEVFDFETKTSYAIRIKTDDNRGGTFEKEFIISVNDLSGATQLINIDAITNKLVTDAPFNIAASTNSGLGLTYSIAGPASITGSTITLDGTTGTVTVTVAQAGNIDYQAASAETSFVVSKVDQIITFDAIASKLTTDAVFDLTATSDASGLAISYSSSDETVATIAGNTATILGAGTTTITASQSGDATYNIATEVEQTLTVNKVDQAITFNALTAKTFGDEAFDLSATSSANLSVTYSSSDESVATISGSTITIAGAGSTIITASQSGNTTYNSATDVEQTLTVGKADQILTLESITDKLTTDAAFDVVASSSAGLTASLSISGPASLDGTTITLDGTEGNVTVTATQLGNANYNAATELSVSFTVASPALSDQIITFDAIEDQLIENGSLTLVATASSNLPLSYELVNGPASIDGNIITFTGLGMVTIKASQTGNSEFNPATPVEQTFEIVTVTALEAGRTTKVSFYPNPARNAVHIKGAYQAIKIININGGIVYQSMEQKNRIDINQFISGNYIMLISTKNGTETHKLVKK